MRSPLHNILPTMTWSSKLSRSHDAWVDHYIGETPSPPPPATEALAVVLQGSEPGSCHRTFLSLTIKRESESCSENWGESGSSELRFYLKHSSVKQVAIGSPWRRTSPCFQTPGSRSSRVGLGQLPPPPPPARSRSLSGPARTAPESFHIRKFFISARMAPESFHIRKFFISAT